MIKNLFKSMLPLITATVIGFTLFACSDDDENEPQLTFSVEDTVFDLFQPEGTVMLKLNSSDPNEQLSLSKLRITNFNASGSGIGLLPEIEFANLSEEDNSYYITFHYALGNLESGQVDLGLNYDGKDVTGKVTFKLRRAHEYKEIIQFKVADINKVGKCHFPVFSFLDELDVEHMGFTEIGKREALFLVASDGSLYPAIQKEGEQTFFKIPGRSSDGHISLMGIKNAEFKKIYTLINKIQLETPDKYGNEYIWLEYPFIFLPEE